MYGDSTEKIALDKSNAEIGGRDVFLSDMILYYNESPGVHWHIKILCDLDYGPTLLR